MSLNNMLNICVHGYYKMIKKRKKPKFIRKLRRSWWFTLLTGVIFAFFIWLTWKKLSDWIGDSTTVWLVTGGIVLILVLIGHFSFKKIAKGFTK